MFFDKKKKRPISMNDDMDIMTQTILAEGITVKDGNLYGSSSITISGVFFGDVDIEGALIITESGNLKGNIQANETYIYGTIEGSIKTTGKVHIYSGSRVISDIASSAIIIEDDALFNGQCNIGMLQTSNILNIAGTILGQKNVSQLEASEESVATIEAIAAQAQKPKSPW